MSEFFEISEETKKRFEALTPEKMKEAEDFLNWLADHVQELTGLANGTHMIVENSALRKAKADGEASGLDMAADTINAHKFCSWPPATAAGLAATILENIIRSRATELRSKLDPPTS